MAKKRVSYFSQLRFDPKLFHTLQAKWILNIRVVVMLVVAIVALGIFSFLQIPRRLTPEIKIPIVTIATILPGASPSDVESLLTVPVEQSIENLKGIDQYTSVSTENTSLVVIQFVSSVDGTKAQNDVRLAVDGITSLPENAKTPRVELLDFENQPVWTFAVSSKNDTASLMRFSSLLKKRLEAKSKIDRVELSGYEDREVQVVINQAKVSAYGINPLLISQAIKRATAAYPAGSIESSGSSFALSIDKNITSVQDIRDMRITSNGKTVILSDIAEIAEKPKSQQKETYYATSQVPPQKTVQFFVYKTGNADITATEKEAQEVVEKTIGEYGKRFSLATIENASESISDQFNELYGEFRSTILLVFLLLLLFLGFKQAVIASLTVPLTFLSAIAVMRALGLSINFLTMFAFLIALGLLIDDTIVTVAAMTRYYRTGKFTPQETALLVWRDFIVPLWSTTITTIWAFVPLLIASGIIGEFIKPIPIVVTATLVSSTSIAVLVTLPLMMLFLKPNFPFRVKILFIVFAVLIVGGLFLLLLPKNIFLPVIILAICFLFFMFWQTRKIFSARFNRWYNEKNRRIRLESIREKVAYGFFDIEVLSTRYKAIISDILSSQTKRRWTIAIVFLFALIGYLFVPLGLVKNEFFPKTNEEVLYIGVDLPPGNSLVDATSEMKRVAQRVRTYPAVSFLIAEAGTTLGGNANRSDESNAFLLTVHLVKNHKITSQELAQKLRDDFATYDRGEFTVEELTSGPPAGADVQLQLNGEDLAVLDSYADKLLVFLRKTKGITNIKKSISPGTSKLVFVPNNDKLSAAGISIDQVAFWLRTYASGFPLETLKQENEDDSDVVFKLSSHTASPEGMGSILIPTQRGQVQLLSLGSIRLESNPTKISRENGKRIISVSATVLPGYNATEKNNQLLQYARSLSLPENYAWQTGGANEENQKSVNSILQAMIVSFVLILITMVIEFRSFRQTLIALLLIPIAVASVFYIFALTQTPLSFPALIGILALFGIVVTHAIVVIEKINENRTHGLSLHDSLVDAAGNRLEPVLLTSLATIVGLIPITLADPLWRGLGGAVIAGLLFSGAIKLFFVPVLYYMWFQKE